jgi:adenylate cyclase
MVLLRWFCLAPIPLLWCLLSHYGWLNFTENKLLDWRFVYRGERAAPVKVVYVDIDDMSLSDIGGWPWSRDRFLQVSRALIEQGGVKAVGFDVVLSDLGQTEIADTGKIQKANKAFASYLSGRMGNGEPPVVLAASFTAEDFRDQRNIKAKRKFPLIRSETRKIDDIEPPELPQFDVGRRFGYSPPNAAFIDTLDGGTSRVPLFAPTMTRQYYHMSVELVRLYLGIPRENIKVGRDRIEMLGLNGETLLSIPLIQGQILEVNWFSAWNSEHNPHRSFSDVLNYAKLLESDNPDEKQRAEEQKTGRDFFNLPDLKGSIVLIGATSKLMQDLGPTPFDLEPVPKVGVHGNLVKTILSNQYLHRLPSWKDVFWLDHLLAVVLTLCVCSLAIQGGRRGTLLKVLAVLLLVIYVGVSFESFRLSLLVLPLAAPLGAALSTSLVALVWQLVIEERQKGRIKGMFSTYLSPTIVTQLVESGKEPELGGHDAEITPYFSDIQSFSSFSEVLSAASLTELLNEYLSACTDIVQAQGGTLDKYIGDAVVAMYGAPVEVPDHALRACIASQLVQQKLAELRERWKSEGTRWPTLVHQLQTRIGLNTGQCMIGNMGSKTRFNYTMMGDNVNLAARMESGAKSWGVYSMCTESTRIACEKSAPGRLVFRPLGRIVVKGRSQAVPIHEIVGLKEHVDDRTLQCLSFFAQGMQKLYDQDWQAAFVLFEQSRTLEPRQPGRDPGIKSNPSLVRLDWVERYRSKPPPKDWDGVEVMTEK